MTLLRNTLYLFFLTIILFLNSVEANAMDSYFKQWSTAVITGPFVPNSPWRYYLQPDLRLIAMPTVFNQLMLQGGVGYQWSPTLAFYAGPGWIVDESPSGVMRHIDRLWTQLNWLAIHNQNYSLNTRTRLEANKDTQQSQISYRARERLWLRVPFKQWPTLYFSCYDEVFINLNHPTWVSPYTIEQNRAFVGIGTQLSSSSILDLGYLNQYIHSKVNQLNNVLLVTLTVTY